MDNDLKLLIFLLAIEVLITFILFRWIKVHPTGEFAKATRDYFQPVTFLWDKIKNLLNKKRGDRNGSST